MTGPNILWICTDQQRWDTLGCYGNPYVRTPHLDRMAQNGLLFDNAFCQNPVCTPSRASFLTGRYPRTTRARQNGQQIPPDEVLITKLLADAGYVCGLAGKLHLGPAHPSVTPGMEQRIDDGYTEFNWSTHPSYDWPTNPYIHWLQERGRRFQRQPYRGSRHVQTSMAADDHHTTWCAQQAINFIEASQDSERPWLYSVNIFDPHHPFDPPEAYLDRYLDILDDIPLPTHDPAELASSPPFQTIDHRGAYGGDAGYPYAEMSDADHRLVRAAYWAMCDLIDDQVGRMLDALERTGQTETTMVIFMSDHGEMLGDHGVYLKGPHFYEEAIHVPLIMSWPGGINDPGRRSDQLVELTDLAPTLLDAAGLPAHAGMQGKSLQPILTNDPDAGPHRDSIYSEYYNSMPWHTDPTPQATMVRTESHKLVRMHGLGPDEVSGQLFDLTDDPQELHNLWADPDQQATKLDQLELLCDRMAWTVDPLPERLAKW